MNPLKNLPLNPPLSLKFHSNRSKGKREKVLLLFQPLLVLLMLLAATNVNTLSAQVTYDENGAGTAGYSLPFTVPAGTDRLLVISVASISSLVTNVAYNGTNATLAVEQRFQSVTNTISAIYYIPLGSGVSISSTISITGGNNVVVGAASFQNIDPASPLGNTAGTDNVATSAPFLNVSSTAGNLIVDNVFCIETANPIATTTPIFSLNDSPYDVTSSYQIATPGTTTMGYTFSGGATNAYTYAAAEFIASSIETSIYQAVADLKDYINSADFSSGTARALIRRLDLAAYRFCSGYPTSYVISTLNSIIDYVEYESGNDILAADADYIIAEIQALINALNNGTVECEPVPTMPGGSGLIDVEPENATGLILFPNPAGNTISLSLQGQPGKSVLIRIYSMQGQLMAERNYLNLEERDITFDISRFAGGIYTLTALVDEGVPVTKKFVVQK